MQIKETLLINNPCYKEGKKITVKGLMLHSVGCPQPSALVFVNNWNKSSYKRACVHGFIDANTGVIYQGLPWNFRGWHGGGSSNNTHIGVEMCEPAQIKYTGGSSFTCSNIAAAKEAAKRTYDAAVELFAFLCKEYNLNPLADGVIVTHSEGYKKGIASNHGDAEHLWNGLKMGYTLDGFRKAVAAAMGTQAAPTVNKPLYRVQIGAFSKYQNAVNLAAKVKAAGFDTYIVQSGGLYKVQVGAYSSIANAQAMKNKLSAAGFNAFIAASTSGTAAAPVKKTVDEIAREVIAGKWGSGATRKNKLEAAGYDYSAVQKRVNELLK